MKLQFLLVPYDSGHREWRMGRGPAYLLRHGAGSAVRALGHEVDAVYIEPGGFGDANPPASTEIATSFSLYREVAVRARAARAAGALPVVLSGNCGASLGAVAAATTTETQSDIGVVWLDAHGDFNTPETTASGFLDGMALAALTGRCWRTLTATIPGFAPVADGCVVLTGVRDVDPAEEVQLEESEVNVVRAESIRRLGIRDALAPALALLAKRVARVHLHVDADVLDAEVARANAFAVTGGLTIAELEEVTGMVASRFEIVSLAFTAYDPAIDIESVVPRAIVGVLETLLDVMPESAPDARSAGAG
jgi:arginase